MKYHNQFLSFRTFLFSDDVQLRRNLIDVVLSVPSISGCKSSFIHNNIYILYGKEYIQSNIFSKHHSNFKKVKNCVSNKWTQQEDASILFTTRRTATASFTSSMTYRFWKNITMVVESWVEWNFQVWQLARPSWMISTHAT